MKSQNNFIIPAQALDLSHFRPDDPFAIHCGENTLVVVPESMTALQAANTITVLTEITSDLIAAVKDACGTCEERLEEGLCPTGYLEEPDQCPLKHMDGIGITVADALRKDAGIPLDAKLEVYVDMGELMVSAADYEHDLTDVPPIARETLALAGVCPGHLNHLIIDGTEVWHG